MGAENRILQVDTGGPSNAIVKQPHKAKQFSKMSPTPLKKFVEGGVSDDQRRAINSIGFGSFLFLDVDEMPSDLCRWLLRHFDPFKCSINLKNIQLDVTVDDFHLALGLPKSGSNVQEAGRREATLEYNDLVTSWLNHLQRDRNNITISDVIAKMKQQVDGGDDFRRNFVIVVVSTLIKGNQKGLPNYKLLKSLGDVNSITSLNWSQFALESLTDCARDWQESDGTSLFTGPMLPSLLCYMDRVSFMGRLVNRQFPLIRWWKKKDIAERRNFELLKAGEFGTGDVKERIEAHNEGNQANNRSEQEFLRANTDSKK